MAPRSCPSGAGAGGCLPGGYSSHIPGHWLLLPLLPVPPGMGREREWRLWDGEREIPPSTPPSSSGPQSPGLGCQGTPCSTGTPHPGCWVPPAPQGLPTLIDRHPMHTKEPTLRLSGIPCTPGPPALAQRHPMDPPSPDSRNLRDQQHPCTPKAPCPDSQTPCAPQGAPTPATKNPLPWIKGTPGTPPHDAGHP